MTLSKLLTTSMLGVAAFSSGAMARRDLTDAYPDNWPADWPKPPGGWPSGDSHDPPSKPSPPPSHGPTPAPYAQSGGSSGGSTTVRTSSASCTAVATAGSNVKDDEALASASADAAAYVCGKGSKTDHDIASATAKAFAVAVASITADCEASGDASFSVDVYAKAVAKANVWLEAYAEAFASAGDCEQCQAYASSWGYVKKEVFLKAVAEASGSIEKYANGGDISVHISQTEKDIDAAVATAYAEALAGARSYHDSNECYAWAGAGGCIYTEEHGEQCFKCEAQAVSFSSITEINAIATASTGAAAFACGSDTVSFANTEATAKALAEATAEVVSFVYASCETDHGAYACAAGQTHIEESARAVAEAFADSWALALTCKDTCKIKSEADAIGDILVTAASDAYGALCVGDGNDWTVVDFQTHIETGYIEAIAKAVALAFSSNDPGFCLAATTADAYVG